ncbi:hypothetical protein OG533_35240 [Streptomyces sp. NBC_01186]|uniref:hypothetical protein n=1 Tax=unclassified Streptomyces TaxID=2593676 RepID=UPI002DDC7D4F|nr:MULTISPECIES: hypothetical protein [unclassified Streptomyces]WSB75138.1 hypothetical protein OHB04_04660 [Streptomyces sp. NBC_01775]WSS16579.1 hypothetical protein OG533_35240 [Streptomyces sp. NBC_01186]
MTTPPGPHEVRGHDSSTPGSRTTQDPKAALITPPGQHTPLRTTWNNGPLTTSKTSTPKIGTLNPGTGT